jgi:hypothetical protein
MRPEGEGSGGTAPPAEPTADDRLAAAEAQAVRAVSRYREMVAASPDLVADMVRGATIEEIDASAEAARQAYATISRQIAQQHEQSVSPGNPSRSSSSAGAEALKPEAKIALGLRGR